MACLQWQYLHGPLLNAVQMLPHLRRLGHLLSAPGKDYMNVIAGILSLEGECEV